MGSVRPAPRVHQEKTVLKKTGIIAAVAVAGVIALTPFAFANNDSHTPEPAATVEHTSIEEGNLSNDCPIDQSGQTIDNNLTGGDSFAGLGGAVANIEAPVSAPIAALNCVNLNVEDVIDQGSNNTTREVTETEIEDSYNSEG
jgi:hypothetical protein